MKIRILLFFAAMLMMTQAWADDNGSCGTNATWYYNSTTKTLTISGTGAMTNYNWSGTISNDNRPWKNYKSDITSIVVNNGITAIGNKAFISIYNLTSVTLPTTGLVSIGNDAFKSCSSLSSITIPSSVTTLGYAVFSGCGELTSLTIPSGVTAIPHSLCQYCYLLETVNLPNGLTSIGYEAFYKCYVLSSISIPSGVTSIGHGAFSECRSLSSITIPSGVTELEYSTFSWCTVLTSVSLPEGLTTIGGQCFHCCNSLTSLTIPSTVTKITGTGNLSYKWGSCPALTDLYLNANPANLTWQYYGDTDFIEDPLKTTRCHVPYSYYNTYVSNFSGLNVTFVQNDPAGTEDEPYPIASLADWNAFANKVNTGAQPNIYAKQTANISGVTTTVGTSSHTFQGTYDGQGYNINNVSISGSNNVGLFGYVNGGTIKNVVLRSGYISATGENVGGIVGHLYTGTVQYCANYATVSSSNSGSARCGGIVGYMNSSGDTKTVTRCINFGNVSAYNYAGGIVGSFGEGTVTYCQNYGTISTSSTSNRVSGGIVGYNTSGNTLTNNHNGGNVSRAKSGETYQLIQGSSSPDVASSNHYLHSMILTVAGTSYTGDQLDAFRAGATCVYDNPSGITIGSTTHTGPAATYVNFTIGYTLNGGTVSPANPTTYNYGTSTFTLRNPTKTGYTFNGWTGSNGSTPQTTVTIANHSTGNRSYTANWTANTYTVTLNKQSGTGGSNSVIATYGSAMPSATMPTRAHYTFGGYYTSAGGSGTQYYTSAGVSARNWDKTSNTTLYAKWTACPTATVTAPTPKSLTYTGSAQALVNAGSASGGTLQYKLNSGSWGTSIPTATAAGSYTVYYRVVADDSHTDNPGSSVSVTIDKAALTCKADNKSVTYGANPPTYTATYSGWQNNETTSVLSGTLSLACSYAQGNNAGSYTITPSGVTASNYTITFQTGTLTVNKAASSVVAAPTARSLVYSGYSQTLINAGAASGGTMNYSLNNNTWSTSLPTATAAGEYTVYYKVVGDANHNNTAVSSIKAYINFTITYALNGGSVASANPTNYNVTTTTFTLNNPTKMGYTFAGWTGSNGSSPQTMVTITKGSTGNRSYSANWMAIDYSIALPEGVNANVTTAPIGTVITLTPVVTGTHIVSAAYTPTGGSAINATDNGNGTWSFTMPAANVTVNAKVGIALTVEGYGESATSGWVFMASPVVTESGINPTEVEDIFSASEFDLYRFNQSAEKEWENYKQSGGHYHFKLVNGQGYLYATKETKTLFFNGPFNTNDSKTISLDYDASAPHAVSKGWNLVGNPFTVNAYINSSYYQLVESDGRMVIDPSIPASGTTIAPCTGVMVKASGTGDHITFSTTPLVASAPNQGNLQIVLSRANSRSNTMIDKAVVGFNEGCQLEKFYFGSQEANIYIPQDHGEYAIACAKKQGEIPVNFNASCNGEYTIRVNPAIVGVDYLHLIDNLTGIDVDLLQTPSYTFTGHTSDYDARFRLVFVVNDSEQNDDFAFVSNGNVVVFGKGTLQVFDVLGHKVFSREVCSNYQLPISGVLASGVYVLQLVNGDECKSQKIIIKK